MHSSINAGVCGVAAALRMAPAEPHMMTLQRGADKVSGFLALPRDPGRHRAVIAMHEWWGLNDWVKEQATNLAANGYVALAVDLYRGTSPPTPPRPAS